MTVKNIEFERSNLKHTNYTNHIRKYKIMHTTADTAETEIPESVIRVLYRIFTEVINQEEDKQDEE